MGNVTQDVWNRLEKIYSEVAALNDMIGLEYDIDADDYICTNQSQVDEEWCDRDLLVDLDTLQADLGYFLGK
jgi:hypothetical protein